MVWIVVAWRATPSWDLPGADNTRQVDYWSCVNAKLGFLSHVALDASAVYGGYEAVDAARLATLLGFKSFIWGDLFTGTEEFASLSAKYEVQARVAQMNANFAAGEFGWDYYRSTLQYPTGQTWKDFIPVLDLGTPIDDMVDACGWN